MFQGKSKYFAKVESDISKKKCVTRTGNFTLKRKKEVANMCLRHQAGTSPGSQKHVHKVSGEEKILVFIGSYVALIAF